MITSKDPRRGKNQIVEGRTEFMASQSEGRGVFLSKVVQPGGLGIDFLISFST